MASHTLAKQHRSTEKVLAYLAAALSMPAERVGESFRVSTPADIPKILELRRDTLGNVLRWDDGKYWHWKYLEQPGIGDGEIPCWVFEKGAEIIGAMGFERVQLNVKGKVHPAVWSYDIMVRPDYDGRGLGVLMNLVFQERFPLLLTLGTNERATGMLERLFARLPSLRCWKKIITTRPFFERRLGSPALATALSTVCDPLLAASAWWRRQECPTEMEFRVLERFDHSVDLLCDRVSRHGKVLVQRSPDYLNWRFGRDPRWRYDCYGAFTGSQLWGYIVTQMVRQKGRQSGLIIDWLCDDQGDSRSISMTRVLMQFALERLTSSGANAVYVLSYDAASEHALRALDFIRDPAEDVPCFVGASPEELQDDLLVGENWFLTKGDSDIG